MSKLSARVWKAATPSGSVVNRNAMASTSAEGRAQVAGVYIAQRDTIQPGPARSDPTQSGPSRVHPNPPRTGQRSLTHRPRRADREQAERRRVYEAEKAAKTEEWLACVEAADSDHRPIVSMAAITATPTERRSPDHYGLGRQLNRRPAEAPREHYKGVADVAWSPKREQDEDAYVSCWTRPAERR